MCLVKWHCVHDVLLRPRVQGTLQELFLQYVFENKLDQFLLKHSWSLHMTYDACYAPI
jgi:hypothetical protein